MLMTLFAAVLVRVAEKNVHDSVFCFFCFVVHERVYLERGFPVTLVFLVSPARREPRETTLSTDRPDGFRRSAAMFTNYSF